MLSDTLKSGIYISCDVANRKITAYAGSTQENKQLQSSELPLNVTIALDSWHTVQTGVAMADIKIIIDGSQVLSISQMRRIFGSFGIGASFGHRAVF